jgi:hypothetical protein
MRICRSLIFLLSVALAASLGASSQFSKLHSSPTGGDSGAQLAELFASDATGDDSFGHTVAVDGNTVVAGAPYHNSGQGAAYVYVKPAAGWGNMTETAELTASDAADYNYFAWSVAIKEDTIVVGAIFGMVGGNQEQGAVYVFVRPAGGWRNMTETAKLTASDGAAGDQLGDSVSLDGNAVVSGAASATISGQNQYQGAVYVFVKPASGWKTMTQTAKLTASDAKEFDQLGWAVSISGNTTAATAPGRRGTAYVFVRPASGWSDMTQTAKLIATDSGATGSFGLSVGISSNTVAVGASVASGTGTVYVFVEPSEGWTNMAQTAELSMSGFTHTGLGASVAIAGNTIVAGAPTVHADKGAAAAYIKPSSGWIDMTSTAHLLASDGRGGDYFGAGVSISGSTVVVGAPQVALRGLGKAYVFGPLTSVASIDSFRSSFTIRLQVEVGIVSELTSTP